MENRTQEVALCAIFAALAIVVKQFKIPIVPGLQIKFTGVFNYLPPSIVSFPFIWVSVLSAFVAGGDPLKKMFTAPMGRMVVFFTSRLLPRTTFWRVLSMVFGTFTASAIGAVYRDLMQQVPFQIGFPACMLSATIQAGTLFVLAPPILKALESLGVIRDD